METFPLSPYTPLVGYNNAGKSNVLHAIKWLLRKEKLDADSFFDVAEPIEISGLIEGITEDLLNELGEHRKRLEPFVTNGMLEIKRVQPTPESPAKEIRLYVLETQEDGAKEWKVNPTGIDAAISAIFPEPIVVGAMENAADDVGKNTKSSTIGRLLSEILVPLRERQEALFGEAIAAIENVLSVTGENRADELEQIDRNIAREIGTFFPGINAKVHIPSPSVDSLLKVGTIKVSETGNEDVVRDISAFGHGSQRSIQMALLKCLAETRRNGREANSTTLLLIDEPELYLHPQAIEHVRLTLKSLAEQGYQVLFSTHSPQMISRYDVENVLLVRKNEDNQTYIRKRIKDAVQQAVEGAEHQVETLFSLSNSSKILFSEKVLLAEGKTEKRILPIIFEVLTEKTLEENKIALVDIGSVDGVSQTINVLDAMDLPVKAIVDIDFVFRGAVDRGLIANDDVRISACLDELIRLRDVYGFELAADGRPTKGNNFTSSQIFELLAESEEVAQHLDDLFQYFLEKNIWFWRKGTIESHLDLNGKSSSEHARYVQRIKQNGVDGERNDLVALNDLFDWLVQ